MAGRRGGADGRLRILRLCAVLAALTAAVLITAAVRLTGRASLPARAEGDLRR